MYNDECAKSAVAPIRTDSLPNKLEVQTKLLDELHSVISDLRNALSPYLSNVEQANPTKGQQVTPPAVYYSDAGNNVQQNSFAISGAIDRIRELIGRVDS